MSETEVLTPAESALKKYAKAFYAKARATVQAAKARFVAVAGDNETPVRKDEGVARKFARRVLAVPKWVANVALLAVRAASYAAMIVVTGAGLAVLTVVGAVVLTATVSIMVVYKIAQGIALVARTPYLIARGGDCLKTDWSGYACLWTPKYFRCVYISQVCEVQVAEAKAKAESAERHPASAFSEDRTKTGPTQRQRKHRPARVPALALVEG